MIIAKIVQSGQVITLEDALKTFQYSANLQMQFIKDNRYKDYTLVGFYKPFKNNERLLSIDEDGIFTLGADVFKENGTVYFSFSLNKADGEIIHLGVIEYAIRQSFGNGDAILPEEQDTWISVVSTVVKEQVSDIWDKDYKPQLEENLNIIETKTEEINAAAMEVKQDAAESSTNAKSALDSANLARSSANAALEAKEKALEYMASAERFKNSASNFADQANLAGTEASKSATSASNSASSSLENANKAKEHLDNVTEKVNAFNVDYASKVEDFNSNAENANDALDKKITDANTSIDAKVTEATEQARKAKQEADRAVLATDGKLNKNQGPENAGKAMVVDADGNVVPGSALPDNVYTQEEVDYLLADKMDKPYVDITITDNTTIENTLDGNFKIDSIEGNTVQKIETDIVPTPSRPVPIISKKINVGGEVVELRSLKESSNLFDIKMYGFEVGLLNNNGILQPGFTTYFTSGYIPIKKSTQYMVGILGLDGYTLTGVFFYDQNYNLVAKTDSKPFTTPANSMYVKFGCTKNGGATDEINKHAMLVEGATVPSAYVAPTVRDYKIVDHTNKKSWIERNIQEVNLNNLNFVYNDTKTDYTRFYAPLNPTVKHVGEIYSNSFPSYKSYDYTKESIYGGNTSGGKTLSVIVKDSNVAEHTKEALLDYINNPNAVAYYALETPIVEEIPYLESDTSEFGVSSQDTTSPSPSIKSNIESVKVLNIKACGKNMFNPQNLSGGEIVKFNGVECYKYIDKTNNFIFDFSHNNIARQFVFTTRIFREDGATNMTNMHFKYSDGTKTTMQIQNVNQLYTFTSDPRKILKQIEGNYSYAKICYIDLSVTQLEVGDAATDYEPYQDNGFYYELEEPLLSLADGSVADVITLENRINKLSINTFTGKETFSGSYADQKGYYGRYYMLNKAYGNMVQKVFCNGLPHVPSSWSLAQEGCCQNATQLHLKFSNLRLGIKDDTPVAEKTVAFSNYIKELYNNGTPIEFLYVLKEPATEPLEPELVKKLKQLKTYGSVTHIFIYGEIKPTVNGSYPKNILLAQQKLETKLLTLQEEMIKNV